MGEEEEDGEREPEEGSEGEGERERDRPHPSLPPHLSPRMLCPHGCLSPIGLPLPFLLLLLLSAAHSAALPHQLGHSRLIALRETRAEGRLVVAPSVAKADFFQLGSELGEAVEAGAEWLHFSVQDGRMVPKISFGTPVVAALRNHFPTTVFDVKLSIIEPERRVADFAQAGADIISVHPEATLQLPATLDLISSAGCAPGVVLNPGTPLSVIEPVLEPGLVDVIVVMLVNPGHGGPMYMDTALRKIDSIKRLCAQRGMDPWIEVDGGVSAKNARLLIAAGANALVAGGALFKAEDKRTALRQLRPAGECQP